MGTLGRRLEYSWQQSMIGILGTLHNMMQYGRDNLEYSGTILFVYKPCILTE